MLEELTIVKSVILLNVLIILVTLTGTYEQLVWGEKEHAIGGTLE